MRLKTLVGIDWQYTDCGLSEAYYLAYYMPYGDVTNWTARIHKFKNKEDVEDYEVLTNLVTAAIKEDDLHFDFVVRVLGHNQICAKVNDSIRDFAIKVSEAVNAIYVPALIRKHNATVPLHTLGRQGRFQVSAGNYYVDQSKYEGLNLNNKKVLIVDDITTTGSSLIEICRALHEVWPDAKVYSLCLARTKNDNPSANLNL